MKYLISCFNYKDNLKNQRGNQRIIFNKFLFCEILKGGGQALCFLKIAQNLDSPDEILTVDRPNTKYKLYF